MGLSYVYAFVLFWSRLRLDTQNNNYPQQPEDTSKLKTRSILILIAITTTINAAIVLAIVTIAITAAIVITRRIHSQ